MTLGCAGDGPPAGGNITASQGGGMSNIAGSGGTANTSPTAGSGGTAQGGAQNTGGAAMNTGGAVSTSVCQRPTTLLCEDFEGFAMATEPAAPNWRAQPAWQQERIVIDGSRKHSGNHAAKVVATSYAVQLIPAQGFPVTDNRFYVRAWINLGKSTADIGGHVSFIEGAEAEGDNGEELRLGASHGMVDVNLIPGSKGTGGGEKTQFSNGDVDIPSSGGAGVVLAADSWTCIEALFDGAAHTFRAWMNDEEITGLHVTDWQQGRSEWSPDYQFLKIGGQNFSGDAGTIWYDDIVVATEPIGCSD